MWGPEVDVVVGLKVSIVCKRRREKRKENKGRGGRYQLASKPRGTLDFVPDKEASTEEEISVAYRTSDVCTGKVEVYSTR